MYIIISLVIQNLGVRFVCLAKKTRMCLDVSECMKFCLTKNKGNHHFQRKTSTSEELVSGFLKRLFILAPA